MASARLGLYVKVIGPSVVDIMQRKKNYMSIRLSEGMACH